MTYRSQYVETRVLSESTMSYTDEPSGLKRFASYSDPGPMRISII